MRPELAETKAIEMWEPMFAPAVVAPVAPPERDLCPKAATDEAGTIEIMLGGATVRIRGSVDARSLIVDDRLDHAKRVLGRHNRCSRST